METHIYDEKNGLSYTLHGDYYLPDLVLNEEEPIYGKYGILRKQFLKEHRFAKYQYLLLTGKLTEHLNQIDQESREQVEMLMEQMAEKQGVTEELKVQNRTKWVRLMNNIKASAEEMVLRNTLYISIVCKGLNRKSIILSGLLRFISHLLIFITVTDIVITVTVIMRECHEG